MGWRAIVVILLLAVLAVFVAINWGAFVEPTTINLIFTEVEAPLGLIMLGFVGLLTVLFLLYAISIRTQSVVEARRLLRDLESARKLAEESEQSRFVELREMLISEFEALRATVSEQSAETRLDMESSTNVLTAHLGQIDDYLKIPRPEVDEVAPDDTGSDDRTTDADDKG